jgi:hypothetical protein
MVNPAEIKRNAPEGSIISKLSESKIQELLEKEEKYDKAAQRAKGIGTRLRIKSSLLIAKARKAGITVTKEEVDREMKLRGL